MPRGGPCSPWVTAAQLKERPKCRDLSETFLETAATVASDLLYRLSGQQFTGANCGPVTIRPVARPVDVDLQSWGTRLSPIGYFSSWGSCAIYGSGASGVVSHYGCSRPPEIELGAYPVTAIDEVLIDGVVIPSNEYQLQDYRVLVRMRPTASSVPTERWGWPTCQQLDLPDTQLNTFSVTYHYGQPPPAAGILACQVLGEQLALSMAGEDTDLPQRITSITRAGVSAMVVDVMDFLAKGQTGLYEVDLFIRTYNPHGQRRKPIVWSPDRGRARRNPTGIT